MSEESSGFAFCRPVFPVADMAASLSYYTNALGFTLEWVVPEPGVPDGDYQPGATAHVFRGHVELLLRLEVDATGPAELVVGTRSPEAVDEIHEEYRTSGAFIREPPRRRPWGTYEMRLRDPDRHLLRLLTNLPGEG